MEDRLNNVSIYVHQIKGTKEVRVFEISNEYCGKSRFTDINKDTGEESMEFFRNSGSPKLSKHEGIKRYLMGSARDSLILERAGLSLKRAS